MWWRRKQFVELCSMLLQLFSNVVVLEKRAKVSVKSIALNKTFLLGWFFSSIPFHHSHHKSIQHFLLWYSQWWACAAVLHHLVKAKWKLFFFIYGNESFSSKAIWDKVRIKKVSICLTFLSVLQTNHQCPGMNSNNFVLKSLPLWSN